MKKLAPEPTSKKTILPLGLLFGLVLAGCGPAEQGPPAEVDLILTNGKVLTVDENFSIHDTVVVDEGLIVATGGAALLQSYNAPEVVDLQGKVLMPGFIDSHTHIRGRPNHYIDLTEAGSVVEIQQLVQAKAEEVGAGNWVTGYGWSEDQLTEGRRPLRDDLDAAAPDNPVILTRAGGHSAVSNSMALDLADVTPETPDPLPPRGSPHPHADESSTPADGSAGGSACDAPAPPPRSPETPSSCTAPACSAGHPWCSRPPAPRRESASSPPPSTTPPAAPPAAGPDTPSGPPAES